MHITYHIQNHTHKHSQVGAPYTHARAHLRLQTPAAVSTNTLLTADSFYNK